MDQSHTTWRKSSRCSGGGCIEIADTVHSVHMRDSKDPESPVLSFSTDSWAAFLDGVRAGDFTSNEH